MTCLIRRSSPSTRSTSGIRRELDLDPVLRRLLAHHHDAALERLSQRERRDLELDLARLDLGQVEDVVDQREQVVPRREDVVEVLRLLLVDRRRTSRSRSTCEKPMIAFSGVRSSCDMLARNSDLWRLVASSSEYRRLSSSFIRLTLAASAPSSSRFSTSTCPEKSPDAIAGQPSVDPLDRSDHRPREDEAQQQREDDRPHRDADEQVPRVLRRSSRSGRSGRRSARSSDWRARRRVDTGRSRAARLVGGGGASARARWRRVSSTLASCLMISSSSSMMSVISADSRSAVVRIDRRVSASSAGGVNPRRSTLVVGPDPADGVRRQQVHGDGIGGVSRIRPGQTS